MRVALIPCSNGLGHLRRLIILYKSFKAEKIEATIFAERKKLLNFINLNKEKNFSFKQFKSKTEIKHLINGEALNWEKKLPNLDNYDFVVSDNLPDILKIRKDAIISGSFFWHNTLKNINKEIKERHKHLISCYRPKMISSDIFTHWRIPNKVHLHKVGLYKKKYKTIKKNKLKKNDILFSIGLGGQIGSEINKLIKFFIDNNKNLDFHNLWIEPKLHKKNMPKFIKKAKYSNVMFESLKLAIVRPGVGTLTELIYNQVPILCVYEKNNIEMSFNAKIIENNLFGFNSRNLKNTISLINDFFLKSKKFNLLYNYKNKISFNGSAETVKIISKIK